MSNGELQPGEYHAPTGYGTASAPTAQKVESKSPPATISVADWHKLLRLLAKLVGLTPAREEPELIREIHALMHPGGVPVKGVEPSERAKQAKPMTDEEWEAH
jgi:hypothetical protein